MATTCGMLHRNPFQWMKCCELFKVRLLTPTPPIHILSTCIFNVLLSFHFSPQVRPPTGYSNVNHTPVGYYYFILGQSLWVRFVEFHIWDSLGVFLFFKFDTPVGGDSPHGYSVWGQNSPRRPLTPTRFGEKCPHLHPRLSQPVPVIVVSSGICIEWLISLIYRIAHINNKSEKCDELMSF